MSLLTLRSVSKSFGSTRALDSVPFDLEAGEVHALLGANGSGKSTLSKIVAGVYTADAGSMSIQGEPVTERGPIAMKRLGVGVVYQELSLIPDLSVGRNIMLGIEQSRRAVIDSQAEARVFQPWLDRFAAGFSTPVTGETAVSDLPQDEQQLVEIIKVLVRRPRILILDEATAALRGDQVETLFQIIRELLADGVGVIYITHKMDEIFAISDRVTVLRSGTYVRTALCADVSHHDIVRDMVGDVESIAGVTSTGFEQTAPILRCSGVSTPRLADIDLAVRPGEVLGLGGLSGQGQGEVLKAIIGDQALLAGHIEMEGQSINGLSIAARIRNGLSLVSGDRKREAAYLQRPIRENGILGAIVRFRRRLFAISGFDERLRELLSQQHTVYRDVDQPIVELSGGNQQKVVVARWLLTEPRVLLLDDPTKGIDVKAKQDLYRMVRGLCEAGMAVVWNSSDDDELLVNAHRILVFSSGRIVGELAGQHKTKENMYKAATAS